MATRPDTGTTQSASMARAHDPHVTGNTCSPAAASTPRITSRTSSRLIRRANARQAAHSGLPER